jgi:hypothetical protein
MVDRPPSAAAAAAADDDGKRGDEERLMKFGFNDQASTSLAASLAPNVGQPAICRRNSGSGSTGGTGTGCSCIGSMQLVAGKATVGRT